MIVVNVGTTGTNPYKHSIVSIGAIDTLKFLNGSEEPLFYGECRMRQGAEIEKEIDEKTNSTRYPALEVNGFTEAQVRYNNKESHEEIMHRFRFWLNTSQNRTFCGENIFFYMSFLREAFLSSGYDKKLVHQLIGTRGLDIHTTSYDNHERNNIEVPMKNEKSALSLDEILKYVGLPPEQKPHNALIGAILEAEARWRLVHGTSLFKDRTELQKIIPNTFPKKRFKDIPNFASCPIPGYLQK